jgi:hypothetical protein
MTIGKGKRPRDPNQLAAWTVAVSTGQIPEPQPEIPKGSFSPAFEYSRRLPAFGTGALSPVNQPAHDEYLPARRAGNRNIVAFPVFADLARVNLTLRHL